MALPKYTEPHYRIWHYIYLTICAAVFFFLIAPLFVIFPLSFNAEEFLVFSDGMKRLDPDAFSLRWYKDMIYGTKNPWGLATKNSFIIAIFATIGSVILGTVAALGLSSRHMPYKGLIMAVLISPMIVPLIISGVAIFFFMAKAGLAATHLGIILAHIILGTPFVTFFKIYFPLTIPGIGAGCLLVFILAIGYYITPALVGGASGTLISNQIAFHMKSTLDWSFASAMGLMLLAGVLAVYWVYNKLVGIDNIKLG